MFSRACLADLSGSTCRGACNLRSGRFLGQDTLYVYKIWTFLFDYSWNYADSGIEDPQKDRSIGKGNDYSYIGGFLTGGIFSFLGQYAQVGSLFFALAVASYYLASGALKMLSLLFHFGEIHCEVRLVYGERTCSAAAVIDTGNHLRDPVSGKAVSIITRHMAEKLMSLEELKSLRKIEYHTIGKGRGMLPVIIIDSLWIEGEEQSYEKPMIAVSDDASFGTRYDMILNPDI